jgi:hypothetical protein
MQNINPYRDVSGFPYHYAFYDLSILVMKSYRQYFLIHIYQLLHYLILQAQGLFCLAKMGTWPGNSRRRPLSPVQLRETAYHGTSRGT